MANKQLAPAEEVQCARTADLKNAQRAEIRLKEGTEMVLSLEGTRGAPYADIELTRQGALTVIRSAKSLEALEPMIQAMRDDVDVVVELFTEQVVDPEALLPQENEA
ncbi:hypothetical protein HOG17_03435 [Candidatus Peregrinibacteria bacterium]|jgi:hypothetical protein|nr:hypothetical protein [Candidatus Peregrinibacteria bacterium]MBT4148258.1 hypothetical protein [Candidatus Peregrinibacteria bacterium]MBT4366570.1 hypothetical protein [Candidatus Peregrinibacteria bacterium]MBT4455951.1 hypothetical protein [Candidatus Peregrinibacteria bacterium]